MNQLFGRTPAFVARAIRFDTGAGYAAEVVPVAELEPEKLRALEGVSERWRRGKPERGFSMAMDGLRGTHLDGTTVVIASDADGLLKSRVFPGLWLDAGALLGGEMKIVLAALRRGLDSPEHETFVAG